MQEKGSVEGGEGGEGEGKREVGWVGKEGRVRKTVRGEEIKA